MTRSSKSKYRTKYRILALVGSGQFGKVFCAKCSQTKKLVALKELAPVDFPLINFCEN
jgi:serine/threonine-protein kinase